MYRLTDASLPYADAFTTMLSIIAQFLLTRKIIDNWSLWITADVVYVWMYTNKALYWTAGLYVVFLILCVMGYREWRASLRPSRQPSYSETPDH